MSSSDAPAAGAGGWDAPVAATAARRAGFWIRVAASLLDAVIVGIPFAILAALLHVPQSFSTGLSLVYPIVMWMQKGATVGGLIVGLRLVTVDASPLTWTTAIVRSLMNIVCGIPLGLGYLWCAWDAEKQTWADKVAKTYVVFAR